MWIVRLALRRPYTFVVGALVLLLLTPFVLWRTPTDIFPAINIPVVSIIWQYAGLNAQEIEQRILYNHERSLSATVNDIEHIGRCRGRSDHGHRPNNSPPASARDHPTPGDSLQCLHGSHPPVQHYQPQAVRAGTV